jgi:hypothetical protein
MDEDIGPWEDIPHPQQLSLFSPSKPLPRPIGKSRPEFPKPSDSLPSPLQCTGMKAVSPVMDACTATMLRTAGRRRRPSMKSRETGMKTVAVDRFSLLITPADFRSKLYNRDTMRIRSTNKSLQAADESPLRSKVDSNVLRYWGVQAAEHSHGLSASPGKVLRVADLGDIKGRVLPARLESPTRAMGEFDTMRRALRHVKHKSSLY